MDSEQKPVTQQPAESFGIEHPGSAADAETALPANGVRLAPVVELRGNLAADAELKRKRQALELQRERILSERTSNPHRRSALEAALLEIEEKLSELGWAVHL